MSIDYSLKENFEKLGKQHYCFNGAWAESNKLRAMIVYVNGIQSFESQLGGYKFEETDCLLQIHSYEKAMIFYLSYSNLVPFVGFVILRKDILSLEIIEDTLINLPKFSMWKAVMPLGPGGGAIGATIAFFRGQKELNKRKFSIVGTIEKIGVIAKLHYSDENDGSKKTITLNIPKEYFNYCHPFLTCYWSNTINTKKQ